MEKSNYSIRELYWKLTGSEPNYDHLQRAILLNDFKTVKVLFNLGLDPNGIDQGGYTPLINVLLFGRSLEMVELILQYGADPNLMDDHGNIPLLVAIIRGSIDMIELLLYNDDLIVDIELLEKILKKAKERKNKNISFLIEDYIYKQKLDLAKKRLNITKESTIDDTNISDLPADILESISKKFEVSFLAI